mgnify:FL=1
MKTSLKRLVFKSAFLSDIVLEKGVGSKVSLATVVSNCVINLLFRQNISFLVVTNFKSTITAGEKLVLQQPQRGTFSSLVNSSGCYLQAGNGIVIGSGTIWASNVVIVSANHDLSKEDKRWEPNTPVVIGEDCWIGANACIMPGVTLGKRVIVGAGSVVTKSFSQDDIAIAGNPAKIIKYLK